MGNYTDNGGNGQNNPNAPNYDPSAPTGDWTAAQLAANPWLLQMVGGADTFEGPLYGDNSSWDSWMSSLTQAAQTAMGAALVGPEFSSLGAVGGGVATGAVVGAGEAGLTGGNVEKGALIGGVTGGLTGAVTGGLSGDGLPSWMNRVAGGVVGSVAGSILRPNGSSSDPLLAAGGTGGVTPQQLSQYYGSSLAGSTINGPGGNMMSPSGGTPALEGATIHPLGSPNSQVSKGFV
jgi:hypothetical protein